MRHRLARLGRRLAWPLTPELVAALVGVASVVLVVFAYSRSLGQVFLVEARTFGAVLTFEGYGNAWRLPPLVLCEPRETPDPRATAPVGQVCESRGTPAPAGPVCDPVLFAEHCFDSPVEVALPAGMTVGMSVDLDGRLRLRSQAAPQAAQLTDRVAWGPGGVILVAPDAWRRSGALDFDGRVVIGADVGAGEDGWLVEGRYQIRERLLRQWLDRAAGPVEVVSGELLRGDRVEFRAEPAGGAVLARGFVAPSLAADEPGLLVTVASDPEATDAQFMVASFGAREVRVAPNWTDRAMRDPMLIALGAVVTFVGGLVGLLLRASGGEGG